MPAAETRLAGPAGGPATREIFAEEAIGADGRVRTAEPAGPVRGRHNLVTEAGGRLNDDAKLDRSTL